MKYLIVVSIVFVAIQVVVMWARAFITWIGDIIRVDNNFGGEDDEAVSKEERRNEV